MYINEHQLEKIFSRRIWTIALNYQQKGIVETLSIYEEHMPHIYLIEAETNTFGYNNQVTMTLSDDGTIHNFRCECPFCIDDMACAHIGAVLIFLNEIQPASFPFYFDKLSQRKQALKEWAKQQQINKTKELLDTYKRISEGEFQTTIMNHKIQLTAGIHVHDQQWCINYKIGHDKRYVLKNIIQFLNAVYNQEYISYGKHLGFSHYIEAFDEPSQKTIQFLQTYYKEHRSEFDYGYFDKRNIILDSKSLDNFFDLYRTECNHLIDCRFSFDDIQTIPLHIQKQNQEYVITSDLPFENMRMGEQYWYLFQDNCFFRYVKGMFDHCSYLIQQLISENQIVIPEADMRSFCIYVLTSIEQYVVLSGDSIDEYKDETMFIECYIDMEDSGDIRIQIDYQIKNETKKSLIDEAFPDTLITQRIHTLLHTYADILNYDEHIAYITSQDHQLQFLKEGIRYLDQVCEVYISERVSQLNHPKKVHFQIGVHMENNLLEVDFSSYEIPAEELYAVLKSYRKKKKFHRLKKGDLIYLEQEQLSELNEWMEELHVQSHDLDNGKLRLNPYHSFELEELSQQAANIEVKRSDAFSSALQNMKHVTLNDFPLPAGYEHILRDYQIFGYQWLKTMCAYGFGGILADDMGLGKTLQMIAVLEDDHMQYPNHTSIIITPASLILNWEDEIKKFSHNLTCLCIHGSGSVRKTGIQNASAYDVIVTSYDYLRRDYELYQGTQFTFIVLDEAQYIKNHTTKNAEAVKTLQGQYRFALTGTPIENSLAELWSIFDFLMPGYLYTYHFFRTHYEKDIIRYQKEEKVKKLKHLVEPFILRRLKQDVLKELPDKTEQIQYIEFSEEEQKCYAVNLVQINSELQKKLQMEDFDKFQILAMMTRLRQLCCDQRLLYDQLHKRSSKLNGCMDLLLNAKASNKKVLIFSSFTSLLELLEVELHDEQISYLKITGETSKENRRTYVQQFQEGLADVFLISLKAGGTGLNLTAAEIVIHIDPWWNMSAQNQATDRAHRIGQTRHVQVYKLIMKNTIEEKILKLQEKKMNLSDTFTSDSKGSITSMNKEDILQLFKE